MAIANTIPNTNNYEFEFDSMIKNMSKGNNYSQSEIATNNLINMTLKTMKEGKHPALNSHDYSTAIIPNPNITIYNHQTKNYEGIVLKGNTAVALDLFSINKKLDSRCFISIDELSRMKLDKYVKMEDIITVPLQNKYTDKNMMEKKLNGQSTLRMINVESLLKTPTNPRGSLTQKEFDMYFPDFKKQTQNAKLYSKQSIQQMNSNITTMKNTINKNTNQNDYELYKKTISIETKSNALPKLAEEMFHLEYCRTTQRQYIPRFSKEEHLKDMVNLYKKSPDQLKDAIQKANYTTAKLTNKLFNEKMIVRNVEQSIKLQDKNVQTRTQTFVNDEKTKERTQTQTRAKALSRGR